MKKVFLFIFVVILALVAVVLYQSSQSFPKLLEKKDSPVVVEEETHKEEVFKCEPEQRDADFCIQVFDPVCAEVNVQCVTSPCPPVKETFSNSCEACKNSLVDTYTKGECVI
ncbi:MAG: hypothetical protein ACE5F2_00375 [Candidatus Paceibacteria bacterium]